MDTNGENDFLYVTLPLTWCDRGFKNHFTRFSFLFFFFLEGARGKRERRERGRGGHEGLIL